MNGYVWLAIGFAGLALLAYRTTPIWIDSSRRGARPSRRLRWVLTGIVAPSRYWWGARIEMMSPQEQANLLAHETAKLDLTRADNLRCPLCGAEVVNAWTLDADGQPAIPPGPVQCPQCDFRLDACRHCAHFLPGSATTSGLTLRGDEMTFGRCRFYKTPQPVERITTPEMARRLKASGYETINSPLPIVDSYMPPDFCRAFQPERKRIKESHVRWPDARRAALLRLLRGRDASLLPLGKGPGMRENDTPSEKTSPEEPSGDEQWLM